jgi:hypothetical protein
VNARNLPVLFAQLGLLPLGARLGVAPLDGGKDGVAVIVCAALDASNARRKSLAGCLDLCWRSWGFTRARGKAS